MSVPNPEQRPKLLATAKAAGRRERVLALAADLADDLGAVDLDEVDGEFYWRCCRTDLLERLAEVCARRPRPIGAKKPDGPRPRRSDDDLEGLVEPPDPIAFLRDGLRFAGELLDLADAAALLFPDTVWPRLLDGERIAMRGVAGRYQGPHGLAGRAPTLHLKVFSGAWTGGQVEDELRRLAKDGVRWWPPGPDSGGAGVVVRVGFALAGGRRGAPEGEGFDPDPPYVAVDAELPLPPQGTVAREYDELVRRHHAWHRRLRGGGSRQDKEVAVRTWAVGMLVADGARFGEAMAAVARATGFDEVTQARLGQDRARLLARVPEAQPYLYAPGRGHADTSRRNPGDPDALANPPGPGEVANPGPPAPHLQGDAPGEGAYT